MDPHLPAFLELVKSMGYLTKVTTNGSFPDTLESLIKNKQIDFVSVEMKNGPNQYAKSIGMEKYDIAPIEKTLNLLRKNVVDYQLELYLNQEYHTIPSLKALAKWVSGCKKMVLHTNIESLPTVSTNLHNMSNQQIEKVIEIFQSQVEKVEVIQDDSGR